jgi:CheY-like chemotaxis protein
LGVIVWEADSAAAARRLVSDLADRKLSLDVGILDWRMPVEDGMQLCRSLRGLRETSALPMLLISYASVSGDAQQAVEAGFDALLIKPVESEVMAGVLRLMREKAQGRALPLVTRHLVRELFAPPRVLLAEDNPVNQKVGRQMLEKMGYHVTLAKDGREALDIAVSEVFDLILMDCMMPEMDGFASSRAFRDRESSAGRRTPIVACTANVNPEEFQKCLDAGMDDFLGKPYRPEALRRMMEKWVRPAR